MIKIEDNKKCCGCTACESICAHCAISMKKGNDGFLYPEVDSSKCINCRLCEQVCPILSDSTIRKEDLEIYACYNPVDEVRKQSTSGGLFFLMAKYIISQKGVVFGVAFNEQFDVKYIECETLEQVSKCRGSKYVQANPSGYFVRIKKLLLSGRKVFFTGTPCHVQGLIAYLRKPYSNLYTMDFVCMGIPSSELWNSYLDNYFDRNKIQSITFKSKNKGWHNWRFNLVEGDIEKIIHPVDNPYFRLYLSHLSLRPSCRNCPAKGIERVSDVTVADCWGIDKVNPKFDDDKGCTLMICHSVKGKELYQNIEPLIVTTDYQREYVEKYNPYSVKSVNLTSEADKFLADYQKHGAYYILKKYGELSYLKKIKKFIKQYTIKIIFERIQRKY